MSARAIAIHGNEKSGERRANLEIKSECPALTLSTLAIYGCSSKAKLTTLELRKLAVTKAREGVFG